MMKKNLLKPIEIDTYLKYQCDCGLDHWISLRESQTKKFKIVCDCGLVLRIKRVSDVRIKYHKNGRAQKCKSINNVTNTTIVKNCKNALSSYGFSPIEINKLLSAIPNIESINSASTLTKLALSNIGVINNDQQAE